MTNPYRWQASLKTLAAILTSALLLPAMTLAQTAPTGGPDPQPTPARKTVTLPGGKAKAAPAGPYQPTWESIQANYQTPDWYKDAKFGIFMHFGVYTVAAHASEWYPRHMYTNAGVIQWHAEHFGPQDKVGYKDLIPKFKAEKFNPDQWADLFVRAGARFVIPTAEHHDGFAMYDSALTHWDAKEMGPHRDIIGDLAKSVRAKGMKFGISNHRMENWDFMYPVAGLKTDLFDPKYADFYGPPQPHAKRGPQPAGEMVVDPLAPQSEAFLEEWLARNEEIVDKYQPDIVYFDNGVNPRRLDPWKLRFAAYYYNSAAKWGKAVTINTKSDAYFYGTVTDYERQGRAPKTAQANTWSVDDPIGDKFGYVEGMGLASADTIIQRIVQDVARGGTYILNISPMSDGTIPEAQQKTLFEIGDWLKVNGEAIYGSRQWVVDADGTAFYTKQGDTLYATSLSWPTEPLVLPSVPLNIGKVTKVSLLGYDTPLAFKQNDQGLIVTFPKDRVGAHAYALKIQGLSFK